MLRIQLFIAAMSFPLLIGGCGDDATPPSGPTTEHQPRPAARVSATAVDRYRVQFRQIGAEALFASFDPSGCVVTDVFVLAAEETFKQGPGKPTSGPFAVVSISEVDFCTQQVLRDIFGFTDDPVLQADRRKLTEARLMATIMAFDNLSGAEVPVEIDLAWTATDVLVSQSNRFRTKTPTNLFSRWFKGTFRGAGASGTLVVDGENLATDQLFADIFRLKTGEFDMMRLR